MILENLEEVILNLYYLYSSTKAKKVIKKHCITFGGTLKDSDCIKLVGVSRNSYFKYKRELLEELNH